jgi:hypothetical protein
MDPLASLRAEVDRLREENARLRAGGEQLLVEAASERAEGERFRQEKYQIAETLRAVTIERDRLRAHVAALVQGINDVALGLGFQSSVAAQDAYVKLRALLDAPDVAALVARAEKEQAFIEASRCYWDAPTSNDLRREVMRTLAALDTD